MNVLLRNRKTIYLCKSYLENGVTKYEEPIEKNINIIDVTTFAQTNPYGRYYGVNKVAKTTKSIGLDFKAGDKCYVDQVPPTEHDVLCKTADYIVVDIPSIILDTVEVKFKRLSGAPNVN